ncbi:MAG: SPOR domain-containing protein [Muribaculaceae bacterium]|nr:SPOR domain-containing protein [Muribaculaceae bacterium]
MKKLFFILLLVGAFASCKTSEANYRAAYERTIASREDAEKEENTIYGGARRQPSQSYMMNGADTVCINVKRVSPLVEDGKVKPEMKQLMLVVGQFKQKFNAQSLRDRVVQNGYPGAFVVQTGEPYYYVVADSYDNISQAAAALEEIRKKAPIVMKDPVPFILRDPRN